MMKKQKGNQHSEGDIMFIYKLNLNSKGAPSDAPLLFKFEDLRT
jgi:hypothetical protein